MLQVRLKMTPAEQKEAEANGASKFLLELYPVKYLSMKDLL
jgi:hypothetical protein